MIQFGELQPDGTVTNVRVITEGAIRACPHVIFMAEHYREDGTCRCDDPAHKKMAEWGYVWSEQGRPADRYGRVWPANYELCGECGQPDNCGDCNHAPLAPDQVRELGGVQGRWM